MASYSQSSAFFGIISFLQLTLYGGALAQEPLLSLSLSNSTFPYRMAYTATIYDDSDSIYIFAGFTPELETRVNSIYRYSISEDSLTLVGNMPITYQGLVERDPSTGLIYYFSRYEIYKYDPSTFSFSAVGRFHEDIQLSASFKSDPTSGQALFFGGFSNDVVSCYDMSLEADCPSRAVSMELASQSSAVTVNGIVYLFGTVTNFIPLQRLRLLDLETFQVTYGPTNFPRLDNLPGVVTNGREIFVAGGYNRTTGTGTTGILRIHPGEDVLRPTFLPVADFMVKEDEMLYGSSVVYVAKLNRIYFFGGIVAGPDGGRGTFHDKIWYVDLDPLNVEQYLKRWRS